MNAVLPGSDPQRILWRSRGLAALRLIGGSAIADAIADLTGHSRQHIKDLARKAANDLLREAGHEFREVDAEAARDLVEPEVVTVFTRAARRDPDEFAVAMLMGGSKVTDLVIDTQAWEAIKDWSPDEKAYFHALVDAVCAHMRDWYVTDPKGQGYVLVTAATQALRLQQDTNSGLLRFVK